MLAAWIVETTTAHLAERNMSAGFGFLRQHAGFVIGDDGVFVSKDSGKTWTRAAKLKPKEGNYVFTPNWFGCYAWDPVNNILYASAMGNPVFSLQL